MGQILSNSEVEAILSSLDFTSPPQHAAAKSTQQDATVDVAAYDFEHPEPLQSSQIERLRIDAASICPSLQAGFSSVLHSTIQVVFLGIEQSTFCDFLATSERPGCLAVVEATASQRMYLLDVNRSLAFSLMSCLMGGEPSATHHSETMARPFTELEVQLIQKTIRTVLPNDLPGGSPGDSFHVTKLVSDASLIPQATSNEAVALVSYEIVCGSSHGMMQLCIPWKQVANASEANRNDPAQFQEKLRSASAKVPLIATARIANFKLSTRDLASLSLGDVLLTDALATGEASLEVNGQEIFRGAPGQSQNRKVIRLTTPTEFPQKTRPDPSHNG